MRDDEKPSYKREHLVPLKQAEKRGLDITYDGAGYINSARVPCPFLIDLLLERKIINADQHFYGVQTIMMRQLFLKDVSVRVGMLRVKSDGDPGREPVAVPMEDTDYLKVIREIRDPRRKQIITAVCCQEADTERLYPALASMEGMVYRAFENLAEAILALWERKSACAHSRYVQIS